MLLEEEFGLDKVVPRTDQQDCKVLARVGRLVEEDLDLGVLQKDFTFYFVAVSLEIHGQQETYLLYVSLALIPLLLEKQFDLSFSLCNLLLGADKDHLSKVVRQIVEGMSEVLPLSGQSLDSDLAWIHQHLHLLHEVHH